MISGSIPLLIMSGVALTLWMFLASIAIMDFASTEADPTSELDREIVTKYYGKYTTTMYTLLQISTNGELWGVISRKTPDSLQTVQWLLFAFVVPLVFCFFPVLYGNYCLKLFDLTRTDTFLAMHRRREEAEKFYHDLKHCLFMMNIPLDEPMDEEALIEVFAETPDLSRLLDTAGIQALPDELLSLFTAEEGAGVTMRDFIHGCAWLKLSGVACETVFLSEQVEDFRLQENDRCMEVRRLLVPMSEYLAIKTSKGKDYFEKKGHYGPRETEK
jgi:hypothetical protein